MTHEAVSDRLDACAKTFPDGTRALEARLSALQARQAAIAKLYTQLDARQKTLADELIEQIGLV